MKKQRKKTLQQAEVVLLCDHCCRRQGTTEATKGADALCLDSREGASVADNSARARAVGVDSTSARGQTSASSASGGSRVGSSSAQGSSQRIGAGSNSSSRGGSASGSASNGSAAVAGDGTTSAGAVLGNGHLLEHGLGLVGSRVDGESHTLTTVALLTAVEPCCFVSEWLKEIAVEGRNKAYKEEWQP